MKKILISSSIIVAVAAIVIGGTIAYFSDIEISAGNIFTAGSIDLKVDHTRQTYNGVDCNTCSVGVFSSTSTKVVAASAGASNQGPFPMPAFDVTNPHPNWLSESTLAPAQWIWATNPTTVPDTTNGATYTFENKFQWNGTVSAVDLDFAFASDNGYKIVLNGFTIVDNLLSEFNYNGSTISLSSAEETAFMAHLIPNGENTFQIVVRNKPLAGDPATVNPAGLLFNLNVVRDEGECDDDTQFQQTCRLWQSKDLGAGDQFFNFADVKPADYGTNVISLSATSNDAFACLLLNNEQDNDNNLVDPEETAGDVTGGPLGEGELSKYLNVIVWDDNNDGIHQAGENIRYNGLLKDLVTLSLPIATSTTDYLGLVWCAGTQVVAGDGFISCDGSGDQNDAQTDSFVADIVAYAVQQRNNEGFSCANVDLTNLPLR